MSFGPVLSSPLDPLVAVQSFKIRRAYSVPLATDSPRPTCPVSSRLKLHKHNPEAYIRLFALLQDHDGRRGQGTDLGTFPVMLLSLMVTKIQKRDRPSICVGVCQDKVNAMRFGGQASLVFYSLLGHSNIIVINPCLTVVAKEW